MVLLLFGQKEKINKVKNNLWIFFKDGDAVYTHRLKVENRLTKKQMHDLKSKTEAIFKSVSRSERCKGFARISKKQAHLLIKNYLKHGEQVIVC